MLLPAQTIWPLNIRATGYIRDAFLALRQEQPRLSTADSSSITLSPISNLIHTQTKISIHPLIPSVIYSSQSSLNSSQRTMEISASTGDVKDPTSTTPSTTPSTTVSSQQLDIQQVTLERRRPAHSTIGTGPSPAGHWEQPLVAVVLIGLKGETSCGQK